MININTYICDSNYTKVEPTNCNIFYQTETPAALNYMQIFNDFFSDRNFCLYFNEHNISGGSSGIV